MSNSRWANEAYLVAKDIDNDATAELEMLSSLHGVGLIWLNTDDPSGSEIRIPSRIRPEVHWQSVERLVRENADFKEFIEMVETYLEVGRVSKREWKAIG